MWTLFLVPSRTMIWNACLGDKYGCMDVLLPSDETSSSPPDFSALRCHAWERVEATAAAAVEPTSASRWAVNVKALSSEGQSSRDSSVSAATV